MGACVYTERVFGGGVCVGGGRGAPGYGIVEDISPSIILQLSDTEETRAIWPHQFDLYYTYNMLYNVI